MSEEDVGALIAHEPDERNQVLLTVLYVAGLRASEACGLRWRNLQARGEAGQILVHGKGGRTRAVMLPPALITDAGPKVPLTSDLNHTHLPYRNTSKYTRLDLKHAGNIL